jgi:hypothetical protein
MLGPIERQVDTGGVVLPHDPNDDRHRRLNVCSGMRAPVELRIF